MKELTSNYETRTFVLNDVCDGFFCEIQHDTDERMFNVYIWTENFCHKYWLYGLPEDQPRAKDGKHHYSFDDIVSMIEYQDWESALLLYMNVFDSEHYYEFAESEE